MSDMETVVEDLLTARLARQFGWADEPKSVSEEQCDAFFGDGGHRCPSCDAQWVTVEDGTAEMVHHPLCVYIRWEARELERYINV